MKTVVQIERARAKHMKFPSINICDTDVPTDAASMYLKEFPNNCTQHLHGGTKTPTKLFLDGCKLFMSEVSFSCVYDFGTQCQFPLHFTPANNWYQCFSFNNDGTLIQSANQIYNGVGIYLFKNSSKEPDLTVGFNPLRGLKRGLLLNINSPGEHVGISTEKSIYVVPGFQTEIALKKKVLRRLPKPFESECSSETSVKQVIGGMYTVKNCLSSCLFNIMYETCGDVVQQAKPFMPSKDYPKTKKFINERLFYYCVLTEVYFKSSSFDCDCPVPCHETVYQTTVLQKPWRQGALTTPVRTEVARFMKLPLDQVNLEFFNKYIIHLNVYYDDFTVETMIEQELYSRESLLSDFGGLMGLLVGASTISLLEVIWLLIEILIFKFTKVAHKTVDVTPSGQQ